MLITDYEVAVAGCETPEALWSLIGHYFRGTVVDRIVYLHLPPIGAPDERSPSLRADGYPDELVTRYLAERLYRDNPLLRHAQASAEPVYWDEIGTHGSLSGRERAFVAELAQPRPRRRGRHPRLRPERPRRPLRPRLPAGVRRLAPELLREFQWVCQLGHLRYCDMLPPHPRAAAEPVRARERGAGAGSRAARATTVSARSSGSPPIR